jgi:hypothetical protein
MLVYLARALCLDPELITGVEKAYQSGSTEMEKSGAIQKVIPWTVIDSTIWEEKSNASRKRVADQVKAVFHHFDRVPKDQTEG